MVGSRYRAMGNRVQKQTQDSTYLRGEDRRAPVHKGGLKRIQLRAEEVKLRNGFMELGEAFGVARLLSWEC